MLPCYERIQRFQAVIQSELTHFVDAQSKTEKTYIISRILHQVKGWSGDGQRIGFVKQSPTTKRWYSVPDPVARTNIAQAFRDVLSHRYSSSKLQKKMRRELQEGLGPFAAPGQAPSCPPPASVVREVTPLNAPSALSDLSFANSGDLQRPVAGRRASGLEILAKVRESVSYLNQSQTFGEDQGSPCPDQDQAFCGQGVYGSSPPDMMGQTMGMTMNRAMNMNMGMNMNCNMNTGMNMNMGMNTHTMVMGMSTNPNMNMGMDCNTMNMMPQQQQQYQEQFLQNNSCYPAGSNGISVRSAQQMRLQAQQMQGGQQLQMPQFAPSYGCGNQMNMMMMMSNPQNSTNNPMCAMPMPSFSNIMEPLPTTAPAASLEDLLLEPLPVQENDMDEYRFQLLQRQEQQGQEQQQQEEFNAFSASEETSAFFLHQGC